MLLHANAKLGLAGRFALVKAIEEGSEAFGTGVTLATQGLVTTI